MGLILSSSHTKKDIKLDTMKGCPIDNYQVFQLSNFEINQFQDYTPQKYPEVTHRNSPSPVYNCHGMSFASKRTNIDKASEIRKIIEQDCYEKIDEKMTLPGDLVLYINYDNGDIVHSGFIIFTEHPEQNISTIKVVSKWGKFKEVIHLLNNCPYKNTFKEYYRLIHRENKIWYKC